MGDRFDSIFPLKIPAFCHQEKEDSRELNRDSEFEMATISYFPTVIAN
jgi:hypothetical protein